MNELRVAGVITDDSTRNQSGRRRGMMQGVLDDVKQAREAAILGNYSNSTVFYDGALSKLSQYVVTYIFVSCEFPLIIVVNITSNKNTDYFNLNIILPILKNSFGSYFCISYNLCTVCCIW
jgi:hypothetical protein